MRIYIAGQITGLEPEVAYEAFLAAENVLYHAGHTALNPMKLVDQTPGRDYYDYLFDALRIAFDQAEAVFFLSNWQDSNGARVEHALATTFGLPIFYAASELPTGSDWPKEVEK